MLRSTCLSTCRSVASHILLASPFLLTSGIAALAQEVSVTRIPIDSDMTVRLTNLTSQVNYERTGNPYFIVPAGRYSIQLLRDGQVAYQEVEYISADSPDTRTVNPKRMEIVVGLPDGSPRFRATVCAALETAAQLVVGSFGLHDSDVQRRLKNADPGIDLSACADAESLDATAQTVAGSYGVSPLGMVGLSIEFSPLAPQTRPRNRGNSPIYTNPATQRLATAQQPGSDLTPSLVADLKSGITDVAVDTIGKPLLVCAAIDANTPLFCDANGFAVATPAIGRLRGLYRFHVKTTPVDHYGAEIDHWTAFVSDDEYQATQQKLVADIQAMQKNLTQRITQVQSGSVIAPSEHNPGETRRYYPTTDLITLIQTTQAEIDKTLHNETLQPLRRHFPATISHVTLPSQPAPPETDAQKVFSELTNTLNIMATTAGNLGIDLVFRTTPVETEGSRLTFDACDRCAPVISQGGVHRFYRGRYYIHASLDGYVPYEGWLDLMDDQRTILECEMVRMNRATHERPSTCSLKAQ